MKRLIYMAVINRKHLAAAAQGVPYWLLSATLLRKYPDWIEPYMTKKEQCYGTLEHSQRIRQLQNKKTGQFFCPILWKLD